MDRSDPKYPLSLLRAANDYTALVEKLFSRAQLGVVIVDNDGRVIAANPAAQSCLGPDSCLIDRVLLEILPEAATLLEEGPSRSRTTITRSEGKRDRVIDLTVDEIEHAGARIVLLCDITEQRHNDERSLRMEQLAAAGKMAARLSHEIRNPLAGIFAGLDAIRSEEGLSSEARFLVDLVLGEARSVERTLRRLVDATSFSLARPRRTGVQELLQQVVQSVSEVACARDVELCILPGLEGVAIIADAKAMGRALRNLLENALQAMGSGGLMKLGWRMLGKGEQQARLPGFKGSVIGIYGEDTGGGIPEDLSISAAFRPFSISKAATTGLGLAVAQDIIEAHGGLLSLNKSPTGGTICEILLPLVQPQPCWESRARAKCAIRQGRGECEDCTVKKSGSGLLCWLEVGQEHRTEHHSWLARCYECPIFRQRALPPFFQRNSDSEKDA